jgi:hypothetical protein
LPDEKKAVSVGHSSYLTYLIYEFRAIARILPNLKQKPKHAWLAPFALCLLVLLAAIGTGIYLDGYAIHPPAQYTGVCPPPAQIKASGCFITQTIQVTVSGTVTQTTAQIPAGTILTNGTLKK